MVEDSGETVLEPQRRSQDVGNCKKQKEREDKEKWSSRSRSQLGGRVPLKLRFNVIRRR